MTLYAVYVRLVQVGDGPRFMYLDEPYAARQVAQDSPLGYGAMLKGKPLKYAWLSYNATAAHETLEAAREEEQMLREKLPGTRTAIVRVETVEPPESVL